MELYYRHSSHGLAMTTRVHEVPREDSEGTRVILYHAISSVLVLFNGHEAYIVGSRPGHIADAPSSLAAKNTTTNCEIYI